VENIKKMGTTFATVTTFLNVAAVAWS